MVEGGDRDIWVRRGGVGTGDRDHAEAFEAGHFQLTRIGRHPPAHTMAKQVVKQTVKQAVKQAVKPWACHFRLTRIGSRRIERVGGARGRGERKEREKGARERRERVNGGRPGSA